MKIIKLPLPAPWDANTAILHLYRAWSNQGRVQLQSIELPNPNMVNAIQTLWQRDHEQEQALGEGEVACGTLAQTLGHWRLLRKQDGSGVIVIKNTEHEQPPTRKSLAMKKGKVNWK